MNLMTDFLHFFEFSKLKNAAYRRFRPLERNFIENRFYFLFSFQLSAWKSSDMQKLQIQKMAGNLLRYSEKMNGIINSTVQA